MAASNWLGLLEAALTQIETAIGTGGNGEIVSDDDQSTAPLFGHGEEKFRHLLAGAFIQCPRRLVGQHENRPIDQRACHGRALPFTARETRGRRLTRRHAQLLEKMLRTRGGFVLWKAGQERCEGDVLQRGQFREELTELENHPDVIPPMPFQGSSTKAGDVGARNVHLTVAGGSDTQEAVQQGRLTAPAGSSNRYRFAGLHVKIDGVQQYPARDFVGEGSHGKNGRGVALHEDTFSATGLCGPLGHGPHRKVVRG